MTSEEIARYLDKRPFQTFRIFLTDGTVYEIRHPELLMLGRRTALVGLTEISNGARPLFERLAEFSFLYVVRLEPVAAASTSET
jgi:hypothetical protein